MSCLLVAEKSGEANALLGMFSFLLPTARRSCCQDATRFRSGVLEMLTDYER